MKYLVIAVSMMFSSIAVANGPPEGTPPNPGGGDSSATAGAAAGAVSGSNSSATGVGVGGQGGDGGNASATNNTNNVNTPIANGGNANQGQDQGQSQVGINEQGQSQGNFGVNKATGSGNKTDVSFSQNYEAADAPAIAPSVFGNVSHSTCFANVGGSVGWVGAAIGLSGWKEDYQCTVRANTTALKEARWNSQVIQAYQLKYVRGLKEVVEDMNDGEVTASRFEDTRDPVAHWDDAGEVSRQSTVEVNRSEQRFSSNGDRFNPYGL